MDRRLLQRHGGHEPVAAARTAQAATPWQAVQRAVWIYCGAAECRDVRLSCPIEPFGQLIENGIGTGESEHLFGRGNYVQFRECGLHLGVGNHALPGQKRAHSYEASARVLRASAQS